MNCTSSSSIQIRRLFHRFFTSQFAFRRFNVSKNALTANRPSNIYGNFQWQIEQNNSFATKPQGDEELDALMEQHFGYKIEQQISSREVEDRILRVMERGLKEFNREWMMEAAKKRRLNFDFYLLNNEELLKFVPKLEDEFGLEIPQYFFQRTYITGWDFHGYICHELGIPNVDPEEREGGKDAQKGEQEKGGKQQKK